MYSDVIALLDRERAEVERLKEVVSFLQRQCNEAYRQGRESIRTASETSYYRRAEHYRSRMEYFRGRVTKAIQWFRKQREENIRLQNERDSLRLEVQKLNKLYADSRNQWYKADQQRDAAVKQLELSQATVIQIDALRALFGHPPASEVYAAQSELELLRVIRKSQGEGITKLRKERDDARSDKLEFQQSLIKACQERDAWRQEALNLEVSLHGLGLCSCRVVYSNPVEAMKANPRLQMMLDDNRRNIDNQKAYEAPNCPSS